MPFSSLTDPVQIARAEAALERAWMIVRAKGLVLGSDEKARLRLAVIIADLSLIAKDEDDLVGLAVRRFVQE